MIGERLSRGSLYTVIALAPLLLGSNRPIFWILNSLLAGVCLLALAAAEWTDRSRSRVSWRIPLLTAVAFLATLVWMAVQALTLPAASLAHPLWLQTSDILPVEGSISLAPRLTLTAAAWMLPLTLFLAAFRFGTSLKQGQFILQLMLGVICLVAAFGLIVQAGDLRTVGLTAKVYYLDWLTGTFINRNATASFFAIGAGVALALAIDWTGTSRPRPPQDIWAWIGSRNGLFAGAAAFLWVAVLLTGSRGGVLAAAAGAGAILVSVSIAGWRIRRPNLLWVFIGTVAAIALALVALLKRADTSIDSNISRISLYRETLAAIADRPLLGHGTGTFEVLEPLYHSPTTPSQFVWNHAHSGVLELVVGMGIPGAALVILVYLAVAAHLARAAGRGTGPCPAILAALGAMVAAGLHSLGDFNLETQSVALFVAILAGLGAGQAASRVLMPSPVMPNPASTKPAGKAADP